MTMNQTRTTPSEPNSAQVRTAKAFLLTLTRTKSATRQSPYSYGLKHGAEKWGRANGMEPYVSNDALIAAAIELGLPVRREGGRSPNAFIGVSRARYRKALDRLAPGYADPAVLRERTTEARAALVASRRDARRLPVQAGKS